MVLWSRRRNAGKLKVKKSFKLGRTRFTILEDRMTLHQALGAVDRFNVENGVSAKLVSPRDLLVDELAFEGLDGCILTDQILVILQTTTDSSRLTTVSFEGFVSHTPEAVRTLGAFAREPVFLKAYVHANLSSGSLRTARGRTHIHSEGFGIDVHRLGEVYARIRHPVYFRVQERSIIPVVFGINPNGTVGRLEHNVKLGQEFNVVLRMD